MRSSIRGRKKIRSKCEVDMLSLPGYHFKRVKTAVLTRVSNILSGAGKEMNVNWSRDLGRNRHALNMGKKLASFSVFPWLFNFISFSVFAVFSLSSPLGSVKSSFFNSFFLFGYFHLHVGLICSVLDAILFAAFVMEHFIIEWNST